MLLSLCESIWKYLKVNSLSSIIAIQTHYCFSLVVFHISDNWAPEPPEVIPPCCLERLPGWRWFQALQTEQDKQGDRRSGLQSFKPSPSQSSSRSPVSLAPKSSSSFTKSQVTLRWIQPSCGTSRLKILSLQSCNSARSQNKGVGVGVGKSGSSDCSNKSKLPGTILPKAKRGHEGFGAMSQPLCKSYTTHWLK